MYHFNLHFLLSKERLYMLGLSLFMIQATNLNTIELAYNNISYCPNILKPSSKIIVLISKFLHAKYCGAYI